MHVSPADWIAIVTPAIAVGVGIVGVIIRLTRMVDALERLATAMETVTHMVNDHELRLGLLEARPRVTRGARSSRPR